MNTKTENTAATTSPAEIASNLDACQSLTEKVQVILPIIANNAQLAEEERKVPKENIELLKKIGFTRAFQPKAYGGLEVTLAEFGECVATLAGACASTAWASSLLATHSHQLALFSPKLQEEVWGQDPLATLSSSVAPLGKIEEVEGGIRISGDLTWSSGCDHAEWAILGFIRKGNEHFPEPHTHFAVVPRSDYEIIDDWYACAMKGSGTKTLKVRDVFVPNYRIESAKALMEGKSSGYGLYPDSEIFFSPYRPYFACGFSAISLGIAEQMIKWFIVRSKTRVRAYTGAEVGKDVPAYMRLAESRHQVNAARALLEKDWNDLTQQSKSQVLPSADQLANWRTNQAYAVKMCIQAVDRLFESSGANAWFNHNEAQRLFRDSHMTAAHAYTDYDVCAQIFGRHLVGLEPDPKVI
ncbi:flavin-dependent monooxygenase [Dasania sp. GY-MA-18]|uniref:Flavin-dependent monooxygenase n=1 Tax=Dasania phycosphaerae TaxID=2950436 RepID=A0A9J6RQE0_9GAMM|nr:MULTISPECIES: flavin-dependent monooxygenase [Dasania]MCR8924265.1 flavin-dependent monooxygenase [Dasania sp. GY-MA-18]MCZ0866918.1 flavin-dependent monooxygenase [Dasania phycosphaerae]MCZ0870422.1 flavin-dependent monooxygenase [Dasania phycosphaerae]